MSIMRWKLWENNGIVKRADINIEEKKDILV